MHKLTFSAPGVVYTYPREASWFTMLPAITNAASMPYAFDKLANWMLLRSVHYIVVQKLTDCVKRFADLLNSCCRWARVFCQDRLSRSETDADGDAKAIGERVGSGSYYSRIVRVEAKRVRIDE